AKTATACRTTSRTGYGCATAPADSPDAPVPPSSATSTTLTTGHSAVKPDTTTSPTSAAAITGSNTTADGECSTITRGMNHRAHSPGSHPAGTNTRQSPG